MRFAYGLIRRMLRLAAHWAILLKGVLVYLKTGTTPERAYQSLIQLHCGTQGWSNDFCHSVVQRVRKPYKLASAEGILGKLDDAAVAGVAGELHEKGYFVFPNKLPEALCDRLLNYAMSTPSQPVDSAGKFLEPRIYDRSQACAPVQRFSEQDLLCSEDIQNLIADFSILSVAQAYLACQPVLDLVAMWWSTAFLKQASSQSAQLYHFDMDRIKWLKFFIYLTDVTPDSGPHCFVSGSHRRKRQPRELLEKGYARITDDEIVRHYPEECFVEFTGPRGTIIAEDTRGFHKGKKLEKGDRLILQFEFTDCLFGAAYQSTRLPPELVGSVQLLSATCPRIFAKYAKKAA